MSKLILIDGNSLAYRAFYALPDTMQTAGGITTNAIYGFTSMLLKLLAEKPAYLAIAFDRPEPTFRHHEYKEYKATREKAPPTLHEQFPFIKEVATAFNIPIYEKAGFEADDLIGTLAKAAEKKGFEVIIVSGDLDPLQLVNDKIKVLTTKKGITETILYDEAGVEERYQLKPAQLIDYKALKGDSSDNIPGVPGIGEKTAVELLHKYKTLENIYDHLEEIAKPALKEKLKNNLPLAELSRRLGTIVTDVPLDLDLSKCQLPATDWSKVAPLFEKLEFGSLLKKYGPVEEFNNENVVAKKREAIARFHFDCVDSEAKLAELIKKLSAADAFAFDLETTSLDPYAAEIVGISFSCGAKTASYLPLRHQGNKPQLPKKKVFAQLASLFQSDKLKIGHNLKYDLAVLACQEIKVEGPYFDTMVAAYLLNPTAGKFSLKYLAKQFLGRDMIKFDELDNFQDFSAVPIDLAVDYAGSDAEATFSLYEIFKPALQKQELEPLFTDLEMPLLYSALLPTIDPAF